jgi:hypothetical protein
LLFDNPNHSRRIGYGRSPVNDSETDSDDDEHQQGGNEEEDNESTAEDEKSSAQGSEKEDEDHPADSQAIPDCHAISHENVQNSPVESVDTTASSIAKRVDELSLTP